ncbi:type X collagen [Stigmatella aurantiaca DW4/3-1]|uniref:Type X collagen n=1 Tax=Stigmatella aurantiaca (strain DW4/3-1) TaxID=378806 RepID=Q096R9_STIAD|nr:type X collagen [Stigmatella aurantiaca DW4/3-1]
MPRAPAHPGHAEKGPSGRHPGAGGQRLRVPVLPGHRRPGKPGHPSDAARGRAHGGDVRRTGHPLRGPLSPRRAAGPSSVQVHDGAGRGPWQGAPQKRLIVLEAQAAPDVRAANGMPRERGEQAHVQGPRDQGRQSRERHHGPPRTSRGDSSQHHAGPRQNADPAPRARCHETHQKHAPPPGGKMGPRPPAGHHTPPWSRCLSACPPASGTEVHPLHVLIPLCRQVDVPGSRQVLKGQSHPAEDRDLLRRGAPGPQPRDDLSQLRVDGVLGNAGAPQPPRHRLPPVIANEGGALEEFRREVPFPGLLGAQQGEVRAWPQHLRQERPGAAPPQHHDDVRLPHRFLHGTRHPDRQGQLLVHARGEGGGEHRVRVVHERLAQRPHQPQRLELKHRLGTRAQERHAAGIRPGQDIRGQRSQHAIAHVGEVHRVHEGQQAPRRQVVELEHPLGPGGLRRKPGLNLHGVGRHAGQTAWKEHAGGALRVQKGPGALRGHRAGKRIRAESLPHVREQDEGLKIPDHIGTAQQKSAHLP